MTRAPGTDRTRREFLAAAAKAGVLLGGSGLASTSPAWLGRVLGGAVGSAEAAVALDDLIRRAPVARYWVSTATRASNCTACHEPADLEGRTTHDHDERFVRCLLCAQECTLGEGERGRCRARINVSGELRTLVYGRPISVHVDPIEKKPFYHFLPGEKAFSLATSGCPLRCRFCQNWRISQARPEDYQTPHTPPDAIARASRSRGAPVIAFTYNEPTVFTEYMVDIARAAKARGLRNVLISCGFMNEAPLHELCDVLDAIKIDLKGFSDDFYRKVCGARLQPVLRSLKQVVRRGVHLEIVNLVVPTLNDSPKLLTELSRWVLGELGPDVPVHFTRFHPDYQLRNLPPTPVATLERAYDTAREVGLRYPFVGNVPGHPGNHSHCPKCSKVVVERQGFFVVGNHVEDGRCAFCKEPVAGVWK